MSGERIWDGTHSEVWTIYRRRKNRRGVERGGDDDEEEEENLEKEKQPYKE